MVQCLVNRSPSLMLFPSHKCCIHIDFYCVQVFITQFHWRVFVQRFLMSLECMIILQPVLRIQSAFFSLVPAYSDHSRTSVSIQSQPVASYLINSRNGWYYM